MSEQIASLEVSGSNPSRCFFFSSCFFFFFLALFSFSYSFYCFPTFSFHFLFLLSLFIVFFLFPASLHATSLSLFLFLHFSFSLSYQLTSAEGLHFSALVCAVMDCGPDSVSPSSDSGNTALSLLHVFFVLTKYVDIAFNKLQFLWQIMVPTWRCMH